MSWLAAMPAILTAALVLLLPGLLLGWSLGLRAFALLALAPVFSLSLISVAALANPFVGVPWSAWSVAVLAVLAAVVVWGARKALARRWPEEEAVRRFDARFWAAVAGACIGGILIGARVIYVIGAPENISQTFDNIFHLNAIRYIENTGQASSLTVGAMTGIPFYPAAWHALVSLVAEISAASIPVAVNSTNVLIASLVWPLGCIYLCQQALGQRKAAALVAGVVSAAFGAFPILMMSFGVLYPNLLSIAMLPAVLALGVQVLGLSAVPDLRLPRSAVALILALPGLSLAHPSTTMAFMAMLAPVAIYLYVRSMLSWRKDWQRNRRRALLWTSAVVVGAAVSGAAWLVLRPSAAAAFWPPVQSKPQAAWQVLTNSPLGTSPAIVVSLLALLGLVLMIRMRRSWWVIGLFLMGAFLFVSVSSLHAGRLRTLITGTWYNDSYRLAALLPTVMVVPAAAAAVWLWRLGAARLEQWWIGRRTRDRTAVREGAGQAFPAVLAVVGLAAMITTTQLGSVPDTAAAAHAGYELTPTSQLLTSDEAAVLSDLDRLVPAGSVIAANPGNGSALAYALANRETIQLHILTSNLSSDDKLLLSSLRNAKTNPAVCPAVARLRVGYVLDFGSQEVNNGHHPAPGLSNLSAAGVARLIDQHGDAKLYSLTACQ